MKVGVMGGDALNEDQWHALLGLLLEIQPTEVHYAEAVGVECQTDFILRSLMPHVLRVLHPPHLHFLTTFPGHILSQEKSWPRLMDVLITVPEFGQLRLLPKSFPGVRTKIITLGPTGYEF